jgi:hypothetical protein
MRRVFAAVLAAAVVNACGTSGGSTPGGTGGTGGQGPSGSGGTGAGGSGDAAAPDADTLDAFNGACASARWSHVPPACWSCWCAQCADTLNVATRKSMEIFECMFDEQLLVNRTDELACEVRAGTKDCVNGANDDWSKLVQFDLCLMGKATAPAFRACDTECAVDYTGTVCTRYPQTSP